MQSIPHKDNVTQNWYLIDSFWGAFKRHALFAVVCCLPILALIGLTLARWEPEYASTATIVYDVSKIKGTQTESSLVLGNRVTSAFFAKVTDPEFLLRLNKRLEGKVKAPEVNDEKFRTILKKVLPEGLQPKSWFVKVDTSDRQFIVDDLARRLVPSVTPTQFQMSVTATADDAKDAQTYARETMNLYVEEELRKFRQQLQDQLDGLAQLESSTLLEKTDPKDIALTQAFVEEEGVAATDAEKKAMKSREQELVARILLKQKESVRAQAIQYEREFQLESEVNALSSRRSAAHPEVIQKKEELAKFRADKGLSQIEAIINSMKTELYQMQSEMRGKGIPIDRSVQLNSFSDEVRLFLKIAEARP